MVGAGPGGTGTFFSSLLRNDYINIPSLTYTIKKRGYYLVLLSAEGTGVQEKNDIYSFTDDRRDNEGKIRLTANN